MIIYLRKELVDSTSGSAFSAVWWCQLLHVRPKRRSSTHQVQRENMCSMERNALGNELRRGKDWNLNEDNCRYVEQRSVTPKSQFFALPLAASSSSSIFSI